MDVWFRWLSLAVFVALATYAAYPGICNELLPAPSGTASSVTQSLERFEFPAMPHDHAHGWGMWLYSVVLGAGLAIAFIVEGTPLLLLGATLLMAAICPLVASFWQSDTATASALRWLAAGSLFVFSAPVWERWRLLRLAAIAHWKWRGKWRRLLRDASWLTAAAITLAVAPLGLIAICSAVASLRPMHPLRSLGMVVWPLGFALAAMAIGELSLGVWRASALAGYDRLLGNRRRDDEPSSGLGSASAAPFIALLLYLICVLLLIPAAGNNVNPASIFGLMGPSASHAAPLLLIALALVGYAIRERSDDFAQAACLVTQLAALLAYYLAPAMRNLPWDWMQWIRAAQLNAIVAALTGLVWLAAMAGWTRRQRRGMWVRPGLRTQLSLPFGFNLLVLAPAWFAIVWDPQLGRRELAPIVDHWGWAAFALALSGTIAVALSERTNKRTAAWKRHSVSLFAWLPFAGGAFVAANIGSWRNVDWAAFHAILTYQTGFMVAVAIGLALRPSLRAQQFPSAGDDGGSPAIGSLEARRGAVLPLFAVTAITAALALRAAWNEPAPLAWSSLPLVAVGGVFAWLAAWLIRPNLLYLAAVAFNAAASAAMLPWLRTSPWPWPWGDWARLQRLLQVNVIVLAAPAGLWALLERRVFRRAEDGADRALRVPPHQLAAYVSSLAMAVLVARGLWADVHGQPLQFWITWQWGAMIATLLAAIACLWDKHVPDAIPLIYLGGLLTLGVALDGLDLSLMRLEWLGTIFLAGHGLATSYLWSRREGLLAIGDRLAIPRRRADAESPAAWIVAANGLLAGVVIALAFAIELTFADRPTRLLVANAVLVQPLAMGLLARGARRSRLQSVALALGAVAAVAVGWAPLEPGAAGELLDRLVVVLAALSLVSIVYGLALAKLLPRGSEWLLAARRISGKLMIGAGVSAALVIGAEAWLAALGRAADMSSWAIALVALAFAGSCAAALAAAVLPGRDPLGLSDRGRQAYVYGAEVCLGLLFVHLRLTMPWLFHGVFERYWPLIVMLIAYVGAGVGERLRRTRFVVLGEPLERTGALLPLLPVVGFWILPSGAVDYSLLLMAVGLLYFGLAVARKSFGFSVLAAFAANGSLWWLLHRWEGYRLLDHPQLWLVPPALCVLIAAELNKRQLASAQMASIRYACGAMIYVSSTADIFLRGVAQAPWLPLVLGALAIVGVLAGIWLRVRAFLFLGVAFLAISLLTIIWYAAVDLEMTWLWSVTGIVAGVLIIALFAVFEKQRDTLLKAVEQLKTWQA